MLVFIDRAVLPRGPKIRAARQHRPARTTTPDDIKERSSYVALSDDEGQTWKIKQLALATPHNGWTGVSPRRRTASRSTVTARWVIVTPCRRRTD
jgi:hypothetical protein